MGLLVSLAFTAVALFVARLLLKPPKGQIGNKQYEPTTRATRGSWIPILIGTREVEPVVAFAGDRIVVQESSGGKGLFGGGAAGASNVYYESAMHVLTVGPDSKLFAILQDGKVIWEGPITPDTSPSGTTINIGQRGRFTIYWGEIDQPINDALASPNRIGIASRWPYVCYVWWFRKRLSSSPFWPRLTYIMSCEGLACSPLLESSQVLSQEIDGVTVEGVNPAHAIAQLLTAEFPHGAGILQETLDGNALEAFGVLMEEEHLPINMLLSEGPEFSRPVQTILQDMGVFLVQDGTYLITRALRAETSTLPTLSNDILSPPDMERDITHGDLRTSQIVFLFADETNYKYKDVDIKFDDDGENFELGRVATQDERIDSVTNIVPANKIARRRLQELSVPGTIQVRALRGARLLQAGHVFSVADFGALRVMTKTLSDDTAEVSLEVAPDVYGIADIDDQQGRGGGGGGSLPLDAENDPAVTWFELPPDLSTEITIVVFRIRAHQQIVGSLIWGSADTVTYVEFDNQDIPAQGGTLEEDLSIGAEDIVVTGPVFEALSDDIEYVLDLSADPHSWTQGRQLASINGEIFYLESVTVVDEDEWVASTAYVEGDSVRPTDLHGPTGRRYVCTGAGTSDSLEPDWSENVGDEISDGGATWETRRFRYTPNNMIRARYGTDKEDHVIGDVLFIVDSTKLTSISRPIFVPGATICIKSQPFTDTDIVDISGVSAVCKELTGDALEITTLLARKGLSADTFPVITHTGDLIQAQV